MRSYGQFCPVAKAAALFCERWTPLILRDLAVGPARFSQLKRGVPLISPTLLSRRLKELEAEGIVERRGTGRGVTYALTRAGADFIPAVEVLGVWGQRWSRRDLADEEIDLGLLIWGMERGVRPDAYGRRAIVRLTLTDQPGGGRDWWFVNDGGEVELCLHDPGFEVDLYLFATLPDMIRIWRGDFSPRQAIETGRLEAEGPQWARRALAKWLAKAPLGHAPAQRRAA